MLFTTQANGASPAERMRIDSTGRLLVGTGGVLSGTSKAVIVKDNPSVYNNANLELGGSAGAVILSFHAFGTSAVCLDHLRGGNSVRCTNLDRTTFAPLEASAFTVGSDYRLKENIVPLTNALDRVASVPVHRFNFRPIEEVGMNYGDKTVDGFLAHEVAQAVPEAAFGEKDAVNEDGKAVYQSLDQSKLVPVLWAAIQELKATVDAQAARIAALEAK